MISEKQLIEALGNPVHEHLDNGWCVPQFFWHQKNIIPVSLPFFGPVQVHRAIARPLSKLCGIWVRPDKSIFNACARAGFRTPDLMQHKVRMAIGWATRHKMLKRARGLSMHAFGLAIDLSFDDYSLDVNEVIPPGIVKLFKALGWEWGGDWDDPDAMHFQPGAEWLEDILEEWSIKNR